MRLGSGNEAFVVEASGMSFDEAAELLADPLVYVLSPAPGCVFIAWELFPGAALVHQFVRPDSRGRTAIEAARLSIAWVWEHIDWDKLVGLTPAHNLPACHAAVAVGMVREGLLQRARRDGAGLHDVVVFGLCRPSSKGGSDG